MQFQLNALTYYKPSTTGGSGCGVTGGSGGITDDDDSGDTSEEGNFIILGFLANLKIRCTRIKIIVIRMTTILLMGILVKRVKTQKTDTRRTQRVSILWETIRGGIYIFMIVIV